jgi:type II secretory ATPase GspE/PulE/Tfp pilus assembly ATPase PilB-like protein/ActR/RegA family two-component response regulator
VATPDELSSAIDETYSPNRVVEDLLQNVDIGIEDAVTVVQETDFEALGNQDADAAPVVRLTNLLLRDAVIQGASDVHLEPGRTGGVIRFRVDGVLRNYRKMPMPALIRVVSRIKIIARLDIADRLRPQDGRATIRVDGRMYDLRVSTVPAREAEKAVVRVLRPDTATSIADLGLATSETDRIRRVLASRDGIVIVTGPTGSGKTTTCYAAVRELATSEVNVMTVEDPIEYELPGITQIQVEPKRNVTFGSALRAILRQDPDIIFVGEIRDLETAQTAVQAALTGHLVLGTLHANDAASAVQRLHDLGLDYASIAGSLRASIGQRLVRRMCAACANQAEPGCAECGFTGYRGRAPVMEVLATDARLTQLISRGAPTPDLHQAAVESGMRPMLAVANELVQAGVTRVAEVDRVLGERLERAVPPTDSPAILLVDDDAVNRRLARTLLESSGFNVVEAGDGQAALDTVHAHRNLSLVVLDLEMPRVTGLDVLKSLRRSQHTAGLPVVILTGADREDTEIELMDAGADDYIRKPIDPPRFVARIRATLRRAGL